MSLLDDMIVAGRSIIGAPYGQWYGNWPVYGNPEYMASGYDANYVSANGINCTGLINWMRWQAGLDGSIGGTQAYTNELTPVGNWGNPSEEYDDKKWYPCGTLLLQEWNHGYDGEGHIAIVSKPNQLVLQAIHNPGVNEIYTASVTHAFLKSDSGSKTPGVGWEVAGWLAGTPAADGLPGWGNGGVDGYPGDTATPKQTGEWMSRVAADIYGLPGILPVMTSCVELTDAWTKEGDVTGVSGYLTPVDEDSVGWFQQRPSQGWGTQEQILDPEYALSRFLDRALELKPDPVPTDAEGLGNWCQAVQRSNVPEAYAEKGYPLARAVLAGTPAPTPAPTPSPTSPPIRDLPGPLPSWAKNGWLDTSQIFHSEQSGTEPKGTWLEILDDGTLKFHRTLDA